MKAKFCAKCSRELNAKKKCIYCQQMSMGLTRRKATYARNGKKKANLVNKASLNEIPRQSSFEL